MADHTVPTTRDGGCNRKAAHELASLHTKLRSERLLVGSVDAVGSELYVIQRMNTKAQTQLDELQRLIWTCRHERTLLRRLINSDPEVRPNNCCQLVAELGSSDFKEAYRPLGHHAELLAHILQSLSDAPKAVAELTAAAEKLGQKASSEFISSVFNVLYGSCAFPREERAMLELLSRLISLQLAGSAEPRKLLRKGNIAFCRLYRLFMDELSEARVFLTAALHEPVMFLLSQDDFFLDVDPEKLAIRYPAHERAQRFGRDPTSPSYRERLAQHRRAVVDKLAAIGQRFIDSLRKAMSSCFPQSLRWLVCELNKTLLDAGKVSRSEATLIVTDLVFTNFLCAAIINPEPLGIITDTPVGHIARFNLIQIGQILQTLALLPYEKPAAHFDELLSKLDWSAIPGTIADLLNSNAAALEEIVPQLVSSADGREIYRRKACIGTRVEADAIPSRVLQLAVLKSPALEEITDAALKRTLRSISKKLPARLMPLIAGAEEVNSLGGSLCDSPPPHRSHSSGRLKNLADRVQNAASKGHQRLLHSPNSPFHKPMEGANRGDRLAQSSSSSNFQNVTSPPQYNTHVGQRNGGAVEGNLMRPEVCVFPLGGTDGEVPIGMESEEYVMQMAVSCAKSTAKSSAERKQTRFTTASESVVSDRTNEQVSDDEVEGAVQVRESGTATSGVDPTEGSSCSSSNENPVDGGDLGEDAGEGEEEEDISTLPDNFSDVAPISANVSARGSNASLSGDRADTPLSGAGAAAANGGDANGAPNERPNGMGVAVSGATSAAPDVARRTLPAIPVTIKKQNREGLEEKFGKFTLPPQDRTRYHDETYSLVSDSWSTDVGAPSVTSDNEGLNETRNELVLPPPASSAVPTAALNAQPHFPHGSASVGNLAPSTPLLGASILPAAASHGSAHNSANALNATPSSASLQPVASTSNSSQSQPLPEVSASSSAPNSATALNNEQPYYDPRNPTTCKAFGDAKRKLRLVLSSASTPPPASHTTVAVGNGTRENGGEMDEIAKYLKLLLAEAINGRDEAMCAQISEVLRCVRYTTVFDSSGMRKLMKALRDEHRARADYLAYLRESRLTLLKLNSQLNRAKMRFSRERCLTSECLVEVLVRFYLEMKEGVVRNFVSEFQSCKAQDEKTDAVSTALLQLCEDLSLEPMWRNASEENLEYAQKSLERALIAHVYHFALYPNGDADVCRDDVFFSSMLRLQCQVKVEREELGIARRFHGDAPWPLAQDQLRIVNAYKSPRDKMACIVRCCETIESLVLMNSERKSACADDILPIAVFVLIQSNPPSLLSNIQYIHDFYSSAMQGKEAYWWTQFTSAVEFTKQLMNRIA